MSKKKLKTLVLKNSEWLRGKGTGLLFVPIRGYSVGLPRKYGGKMCCLGVLGCELGIPKRAMSKQSYPVSKKLADYFDKWPISPGNSVYSAIAYANDSTSFSDEERLEMLAPKFAELGYRLVFDKDA